MDGLLVRRGCWMTDYFYKIQYEQHERRHWIILLNVINGELSYQVDEQQKIIFSYSKILSLKELKKISHHLKVENYEVFRQQFESKNDSCIGYLDGPTRTFTGISVHPIMEFDFSYYYERKRPFEKLFNYLLKHYLGIEKLGMEYGLS